MKKLCLRLWLGLSLVALMLPAGAGAQKRKAGPPPLVKVYKVVLADLNPPAEYVGHVEAIQQVDLRARVEGFIEKVGFREGEMVKAGRLLYRIEPAPYEARVRARRAQVAQAEAELEKSSRRLRRLKAARVESVRATDIDNAVAAELFARGRLAEAQADLVRAELDLAYTRIQAPISGRLGRTAFTRGNLVNLASGPLARIVQLDPIRVRYPVSENDLAALQQALHDAGRGRKSPLLVPRLRLADGSLYSLAGRIDLVDNRVDPETGTISVWARFANPDGLLLPGLYATVLVRKKAPQPRPVIPEMAILIDRKGRSVMVVDDRNRVEKRHIEIGPTAAGRVAVTSGLKVGERVIVEGLQKVRPGATVRVAGDGAGSGAGAAPASGGRKKSAPASGSQPKPASAEKGK